jgi:hypothetical protein
MPVETTSLPHRRRNYQFTGCCGPKIVLASFPFVFCVPVRKSNIKEAASESGILKQPRASMIKENSIMKSLFSRALRRKRREPSLPPALMLAALLLLAGGRGVEAQLRFGTWTHLIGQTRFDTENLEAIDAGIKAVSYFKFSGSALPNLDMFVEIKALGGGSPDNLYRNEDHPFGWHADNRLGLSDGSRKFFTDLVTAPYTQMLGRNDGTDAPTMDNLRLTFNNPYLVTVMGYKWAKLPEFHMANWLTLDNEWEAGYDSTGGFVILQLGEQFRKIGDINLNVWLSPNRSADRAGKQYGFFGLAQAEYQGHTLGFQWNSALDYEWDTIVDNVYEHDYILGYTGKAGPLGIKANLLLNLWGASKVPDPFNSGAYVRQPYSPPSSDVGPADTKAPFQENMAAALRLDYKFRGIEIYGGYRLRGPQANMMYIEQGADDHDHLTDYLGSPNHQRLYAGTSFRPLRPMRIYGELGGDFVMLSAHQRQPFTSSKNVQFYLKPEIEYEFNAVFGITSKAHLYTKLLLNTAENDKFVRGDSEKPFLVERAGFKFSTGQLAPIIRGVEFIVGLDNQEADYLYNSYAGIIHFPRELNVNLGTMIRIAQPSVVRHDNPTGFWVGIDKKIKGFGNPEFWTQFMWNADPYKGWEDKPVLDFDGYILHHPGDHANWATVRLGLTWDF